MLPVNDLLFNNGDQILVRNILLFISKNFKFGKSLIKTFLVQRITHLNELFAERMTSGMLAEH
ncbi:hypothetical protein D1872_298130 [compost metagenome]